MSVAVPAVTAIDLRRAFEDVGAAGRPVAVHASLRAFGLVDGGADTVVDALIAACPVVMAPAFCFEPNWAPPADDRPLRNGCDYAYYDGWNRPRVPWVIETASIDLKMGAVPRALAARPGTSRSDHPWHSWLAHGDGADALVSPHPWDTTNLPLERLEAREALVLFLGVGLASCTAVHVAEERAGRRPFVRWMVDRDDRVRRIRVAGCSKGFDRLEPYCADLMTRARAGEATIAAAPLAALIDRCASAMRENPRLTVCSETCLRCRDALLGGPEE